MKGKKTQKGDIVIKRPDEIEKMRVAGKLAAQVLDMIEPYVKVGVTTDELDRICHQYMVDVQKVIPAPLNYKGFPKSICTSVNHQVCHGIPSQKKLKKGDIVNIDITVIHEGYHGDTSRMFGVGKTTVAADRVCEISKQCLDLGIEQVKPGNHFGDIGTAIEKYVKKTRCSIVEDYCGHGVGAVFHEAPHVLHYKAKDQGAELVPGMIFTIEPMINLGKKDVKLMGDKWTVVTKDHSLSAQWEHTILVTETGHDVLTQYG
jgi:methionyl aminopeptidase